MCCFSGPVDRVEQTRIFARRAQNGRQLLAYQMRYEARQPVAMILPLPVARYDEEIGATVRFIDLQSYPRFFPDLERAFAVPRTAVRPAPGEASAGGFGGGELPVEDVGDFVASYVPTLAHFKRLDKRFTLPPRVWDKIPMYHDYGFAVFQLKVATGGLSVQPIALSFTSRYQDRLFFPTVHIHDGQVYPSDDFDHNLYWQSPPTRRSASFFPSSPSPLDNAKYVRQATIPVNHTVNVVRAKNLVCIGWPGTKARLTGQLLNRDVFISDSA